jgi:hypothetical protein
MRRHNKAARTQNEGHLAGPQCSSCGSAGSSDAESRCADQFDEFGLGNGTCGGSVEEDVNWFACCECHAGAFAAESPDEES